MTNQRIPSILFVCTGNICRSPAAEIIWKAKALKQWPGNIPKTDSAGTISYHAGEPPDSRMQQILRKYGYPSFGRSRPVCSTDFEEFDLIFAMDRSHLESLRKMARGSEQQSRVHLFSTFTDLHEVRDIPDPYYGGEDGFIEVVKLLEKGCDALIRKFKHEK